MFCKGLAMPKLTKSQKRFRADQQRVYAEILAEHERKAKREAPLVPNVNP